MPEVCGSMTGVIADILVQVEDKVETGQDVIILESMKMHIPIQSDFEGIVKEIKVSKGDVVKPGQALLILE
jgi:acetyl-CoA carboxylase biotin carboxyl carrier protein